MDEQGLEQVVSSLLDLHQEMDRKVNAIGTIAVRADSVSVALAKLCIATVTALGKSGAIKGDSLSELIALAKEAAESGAS